MPTPFVIKCLQSDDDTVWRAGKMIQELQDNRDLEGQRRVKIYNLLRTTFPDLQSLPYESEEQIRFLEVFAARRKAKEI